MGRRCFFYRAAGLKLNLQEKMPTKRILMKTVLIIDDDPCYCRTLKKALEMRAGYAVVSATQGHEGIILAREFRPDIIILDIMMPGMNGTDVAEALLENPATMSIPIMFVTALINKQEVERMDGFVGSRQVMAKPVVIDELILKIESVGKLRC